MMRFLLCVFISLAIFPLDRAMAVEALAPLESAARQDDQLHPGLNTYQVTVETSKIDETIQKMTASMPADLPRPQPPNVIKYWRRGAPESVILAEGEQAHPYITQMVERFSNSLAVELEAMLLPHSKAEQRQQLAQEANIKMTEVVMAANRLQRFELQFEEPKDLDQAFYATNMRLPQKEIKTLIFDIDLTSNTISEVNVITTEGIHLTTEIRYRQIDNVWVPERIHTTNPNGTIDDLIEVSFTAVGDYQMPAKMVRTTRRPELNDELEVNFRDYIINQPLPESVLNRMQSSAH
ncbi:MAG: hypothetical protein JRD88_03370 [Deltaproteobacteria bacterium]|jgi:hypothetical protein|nr:hypothetical protein [Deltaproteobacteria bacterium]